MVLAGDTPPELLEGKRADGPIQISEFMNKQCKKYGYSAEIIPKGVDLGRFQPGLDVSNLRKKHNLKKQNKVLLSVCRLDPRKDLKTLIKAMDLIVNKEGKSDYRLIVLGDGVDMGMLVKATRRHNLIDNVIFLGELPNQSPLLPEYYNIADLFVLPTLYEGFGWVYLEAMSSGTPILTTSVGSNPEIVGGVGRLIKPNDPDLLAKNILEILNNDVEINNMIRKGLIKAKKYSWDRTILKYEEYYMRISKKKCKKFNCKKSVLLDILKDSHFLISYVVKNLFRSATTLRSVRVWESGQVGMNDK
jgi:glycosyltransferase involved in cell wall biosynthesis